MTNFNTKSPWKEAGTDIKEVMGKAKQTRTVAYSQRGKKREDKKV